MSRGFLTSRVFTGKIPDPVPLKHHTETAYMLLLAAVVCTLGFLLALLPALPAAMPFWSLLAILTLLYPLLLASTFRSNRADYEFRALHWFPFFMVALWMVLKLSDKGMGILHILSLGFFFLWSLPLVALGLFFLILFALHVIRRRKVRVWTMSLMFGAFVLTALASYNLRWDRKIQAAIYPADFSASRIVAAATDRVRLFAGRITGTASTGGTSGMESSGTMTSETSSVSSRKIIAAVSSSAPALMSSSKPSRLPSSGPESAAVLLATVLSLYMGTLHFRARARV